MPNPDYSRQPGKPRPLSDRLNAALAWVMCGSYAEAEKLCGISARTIRNWAQEPTWPELIEQARKIKQTELDAEFTKVIHKAVKEVAERLENGDEVVTKDGDRVRKKILAKDAALIAAMFTDKRAVGRGLATSITRREAGTSEKLDVIKDALEKAGKQQMMVGPKNDTSDEEPLH